MLQNCPAGGIRGGGGSGCHAGTPWRVISGPASEFRASGAVAVSGSGRMDAGRREDQESPQVRICQSISLSSHRSAGLAFRIRYRAWRTTCPAIA
ncbi:MAG: hypothetical protein F4X92_10955 [Gammaproteobacteria bacterium]|nr:hypothetical protein [Gammaproteobacteria bacterium]